MANRKVSKRTVSASTQTDKRIHSDQRNTMNLSFSGCGFLGFYHLGVASCVREYAPQLYIEKVSGASAGALTACALITGTCLGECSVYVIQVAMKGRETLLGPLHPQYLLTYYLREGLNEFLPEDSHILASGRLHISLTRADNNKNEMVSHFDTKSDLIDALICSAFVPLYCGFLPPSFKGTPYVDGGITNNLPVLDENTITVSPLCGETDICPRDYSGNFVFSSLANMSMQFSLENFWRLSMALLPPDPASLLELARNGYADTLKYLIKHNLIRCRRHATSIDHILSVPDASKHRRTSSAFIGALPEIKNRRTSLTPRAPKVVEPEVDDMDKDDAVQHGDDSIDKDVDLPDCAISIAITPPEEEVSVPLKCINEKAPPMKAPPSVDVQVDVSASKQSASGQQANSGSNNPNVKASSVAVSTEGVHSDAVPATNQQLLHPETQGSGTKNKEQGEKKREAKSKPSSNTAQKGHNKRAQKEHSRRKTSSSIMRERCRESMQKILDIPDPDCPECARLVHQALMDNIPAKIVDAFQASFELEEKRKKERLAMSNLRYAAKIAYSPWKMFFELSFGVINRFFEWMPNVPKDMIWCLTEGIDVLKPLLSYLSQTELKGCARPKTTLKCSMKLMHSSCSTNQVYIPEQDCQVDHFQSGSKSSKQGIVQGTVHIPSKIQIPPQAPQMPNPTLQGQHKPPNPQQPAAAATPTFSYDDLHHSPCSCSGTGVDMIKAHGEVCSLHQEENIKHIELDMLHLPLEDTRTVYNTGQQLKNLDTNSGVHKVNTANHSSAALSCDRDPTCVSAPSSYSSSRNDSDTSSLDWDTVDLQPCPENVSDMHAQNTEQCSKKSKTFCSCSGKRNPMIDAL